jgi:hypothetical protein
MRLQRYALAALRACSTMRLQRYVLAGSGSGSGSNSCSGSGSSRSFTLSQCYALAVLRACR